MRLGLNYYRKPGSTNGHAPLSLPTDDEVESARCECERLGLYEGWSRRVRKTGSHGPIDRVRACFIWLDAQQVVKAADRVNKIFVESWAGRYVSQDDLVLAAFLHPRLDRRALPLINISKRLILPDVSRLGKLTVWHGADGLIDWRRPDVKTPACVVAQAGVGGAVTVSELNPTGSTIAEPSRDGNVLLRLDGLNEVCDD